MQLPPQAGETLPEKSHRQTIGSLALVVLMLAVGAGGWYLRLRPPVQVNTSPLAHLPTQIGVWQSTEILMDSAIEQELQADFHIQRIYTTRFTEPLWLYVGYYGTDHGGRPKHTPRGCYTGAGWGIESSRIVDVDSTSDLRANEYLVERRGERRLVHFWYRSHRRTGILGGLDQNIDRLLGRLLDDRADGALVRISTPIVQDDTTAARGRLLSFASLLDPLLEKHWPIESPCDDNGSDACTQRNDVQSEKATRTEKTGASL